MNDSMMLVGPAGASGDLSAAGLRMHPHPASIHLIVIAEDQYRYVCSLVLSQTTIGKSWLRWNMNHCEEGVVQLQYLELDTPRNRNDSMMLLLGPGASADATAGAGAGLGMHPSTISLILSYLLVSLHSHDHVISTLLLQQWYSHSEAKSTNTYSHSEAKSTNTNYNDCDDYHYQYKVNIIAEAAHHYEEGIQLQEQELVEMIQ